MWCLGLPARQGGSLLENREVVITGTTPPFFVTAPRLFRFHVLLHSKVRTPTPPNPSLATTPFIPFDTIALLRHGSSAPLLRHYCSFSLSHSMDCLSYSFISCGYTYLTYLRLCRSPQREDTRIVIARKQKQQLKVGERVLKVCAGLPVCEAIRNVAMVLWELEDGQRTIIQLQISNSGTSLYIQLLRAWGCLPP